MRMIALSLILWTGAACAGTLDDAKQAGVLRVGTPGDYAPFSLRQPDGSYRGADVTEVQRLADHLGLKVTFVPTAWGKLADDAKANRFDIAVGGISITPARKDFAAFSTVLVSDGKRPLVRCTDRDRFNTLVAIDQPAVRVIANQGGSNEAFARANLTHAALTVTPDNKAIFAELIAGRQDVMVTDGVEVDHQALLHPELCAAAVPAPFTHFENAFLLQKDPALEQAVDTFLAGEVTSGAWQKTLTAAEREP
ncbi:MAG: transporter substrate-binding domain-containing protein [Acetobacteraceae bacterium]